MYTQSHIWITRGESFFYFKKLQGLWKENSIFFLIRQVPERAKLVWIRQRKIQIVSDFSLFLALKKIEDYIPYAQA